MRCRTAARVLGVPRESPGFALHRKPRYSNQLIRSLERMQTADNHRSKYANGHNDTKYGIFASKINTCWDI
jgi:hypothetical protein